MMRTLSKTFLIFIFCFITASNATNYYVDKDAIGSNNGSSWTNAWESFADINWAVLEAGDTLYISGGTISTTYNETLKPNTTNGEVGSRITITKGIDAGHDGEVIIDGQDIRANGIDSRKANNDYITFSRLTIKQSTTYEIRVEDAVGVIVEDIKIPNSKCKGVRFRYNTDCVIRRMIYTSVTNSVNTTDGIFWQDSENTTIEYCNISILNQDTDAHNDGMQQGQGTDWAGGGTIRDNILHMNNGDQLNSQGIYIEHFKGVWNIYNNVIDGYENVKNLIYCQKNYIGGTPTANVFNNTVIGGASRSGGATRFMTSDNLNLNMKNNIIISSDASEQLIELEGSITADINNNILYAPNNVEAYDDNNWSEWQSAGYDANGYSSDPSLDVNHKPDNSGDPPVDNGVTLSLFSDDIDGIIRPQGEAWDIGAYEMLQGPDNTPPEVTGATLLDSITLKIMFSEMLDETTAEDENNYSISNNIDIFSASLSGSEVTLTTSLHSPDTYIITVTNVEDLAGNPISPTANSAQYQMNIIPAELFQLEIIGAIASSTDDPDYHAGLTIDGLGYYDDPDSRWSTIPMPQYLIFDVGSPKIISETRYSFFAWNYGRIYTYSVLVSNDSTNWDEVLTDAQSVLEEWSIESLTPVEARFIKLQFITSNHATPNQEWAHLWEAEIWGPELSTLVEPEDDVVTTYKLHQNYPNPFNPSTNISFTLHVNSHVRVAVYNLLGEEVAELANSEFTSGKHTINFDATGKTSGVYFYRLETNEFVETKKMILLR